MELTRRCKNCNYSRATEEFGERCPSCDSRDYEDGTLERDGDKFSFRVAGSFKFNMPDGNVVLQFDPDGKCFVRGELVETNQEIWLAFKEWLAAATAK